MFIQVNFGDIFLKNGRCHKKGQLYPKSKQQHGNETGCHLLLEGNKYVGGTGLISQRCRQVDLRVKPVSPSLTRALFSLRLNSFTWSSPPTLPGDHWVPYSDFTCYLLCDGQDNCHNFCLWGHRSSLLENKSRWCYQIKCTGTLVAKLDKFIFFFSFFYYPKGKRRHPI